MGLTHRRHSLDNSCLSRKENTFGVGFPLRGPPAKQQGLGSQRQPRPSLPSVDPRAKVEKGQRYFAEQRCICAAVGSPRSVEVSRMQLPAWSLERSLRCVLGAEVPSSLWGDGWLLGPEDIFLPSPASPRRRTRLARASSSRYYHKSSRGQGARGSPDPLWPMDTRGLGEKKASVAFLSKGALGLWFFPQRESTFPECSSLQGVWSGA